MPAPLFRCIAVAAVMLVLPTATRAQVSGLIIDGATQLPAGGALVTLQATTLSTISAPDGTFDLPGATGTGLVIVTALKGFYNVGHTVDAPIPDLEIELSPIPQEEDTTYMFVAPNSCGACHNVQVDHWNDSPMAKAGTNAWVYDVYNGTGTAGGLGGFVYTRDSEHAATNPESECASCHQPEPWIQAPFRALEDIDSLSTGALHGVSCEVCHKFAHIDESMTNFPGIYPGVVTITRPSMASGPVEYGTLGDTSFQGPPWMRPSYQPQLDATMCASCHQDKNDPDGDGDFEEANGVISEPTYGEWVVTPYADPQSPFYASCTDCHMPSYGGVYACNLDNEVPRRDPETIRHHRIEGTTPVYLENAVAMTIQGVVNGLDLDLEVSITNDQTGHHVPTGTTIRNMILLVEAWREEDGMPLEADSAQVVHDLGGIGDPGQGYYAGLPGKFYAKVVHDSGGHGPTFFTDATGILFDNRIPALATDVTQYTFQVPPGGGTLRARARLIYRRSFRFLVDAKGWTEDGFGTPLTDVAPPYFGHLMEEEEWSTIVTAVGDLADASRTPLLFQNRPNPARTTTVIRYRVPAAGATRLAIFDLQGRLVATLVDEFRDEGIHSVAWRGLDQRRSPVASGVYLYRLETGKTPTASRRMIWLR
jgi:hypothetical protein